MELLVPVLEALKNGKNVIFDIDVQGFKIVREKFKKRNSFILLQQKIKLELKNRLILRDTDDEKSIERRIMNAVGEMEHIKEIHDYLIINDDFEESYRFRSIYSTLTLNYN